MRHHLRRAGLFILAGGITTLLVGPLLIPVPPLKDTHPAKDLADEDSEFINITGLEVHTRKMGQGEPVFLLLHGFAASLYSWKSVMQPLSELGTVIAYDRTGFGLSERPSSWHGRNPYSAEAQVDLVIGLLDHYGIKQAILVGNSAGGTVSMQVALAHPERVKALILVDAAIYLSVGIPEGMQGLLSSPQMMHLGPLISRQLLSHGEEMINRAWHDPSRLQKNMLDYYQRPFRVDNWDRALWEVTRASRPAQLLRHLSEITQPVLVVTGDDDRIVPTVDSIQLAKDLPNASLEVIAEAGHMPHEEQPEAFMQAVRNFVMKTRESGG